MTPRFAVLLPAVAAVLVGVGVALHLAAPAGSFGADLTPDGPWLHGVMGLSAMVLAGVLLDTGRRGLGAVVLVLAGGDLAAVLVTGALQCWVVDPIAPGAPGAGRVVAMLWLVKTCGIAAQANTSLLLLLFPDGRWMRGTWGRVGAVSVVGTIGSVVAQVLAPGTLDFIPAPRDPGASVLVGAHVLALPAGNGFWQPLGAVGLVVGLLVCFPVQLATPVLKFRASDGPAREQLTWVLWAVVAIALVAAADVIVREGRVDAWVVGAGASTLCVAMGVGLLDQTRVSGEDLLANTVVYGGLGVGVLALDVAFLTGLTHLLGDSLEQRDVVLVVLLFSAMFSGPLRAGLWRLVRRWVFGDRRRPYDVVAGLAASLETANDGSAQLAAVARAVATAFGVSFVSLEVDRAAGARLATTVGARPRETRTLPIAYRGTEVGRLVLPARGLRSRLSRRDERLLGDLVRQAAAAARAGQLADELQLDRERLVLAREEELRRIRRDLHDGLGPSLGGAVFQLDSARLFVDRDPTTATAQLEATERNLRDVMDDVRRLVSDLRPPALDSLGLVGALRQQGDLLAGLEVQVVASTVLDRLPAAVEVAAFRIAGEALTNVARHADAGRCTIRLDVVDDALVVAVTDDGVGIDEARQAGVGLLSLRERADELGGRTSVTCPSEGGTVVRAWLPLRTSPLTPPPLEVLA